MTIQKDKAGTYMSLKWMDRETAAPAPVCGWASGGRGGASNGDMVPDHQAGRRRRQPDSEVVDGEGRRQATVWQNHLKDWARLHRSSLLGNSDPIRHATVVPRVKTR